MATDPALGPHQARTGPSTAVPDDYASSLAPPEEVVDFFSTPPAYPDLPWLRVANDVVTRTLMHAQRRTAVHENWLLWLGGRFWGPLVDTQDAGKVLASRGGVCDDAANVLMRQLQRVDVPSRLVAYGGRPGQRLGHALLEVYIEDRWVVADPDYSVVFPFSVDQLREAEGRSAIGPALERRGWGSETVSLYRDIVTRNPFVRAPVGAPLGDRLALIEAAAGVVRWPSVVALFALAGLLWTRPVRRRKRADPPSGATASPAFAESASA